MDPVCHFEIPADNVKRAEKFYESAFGWNIKSMPNMGYSFLQTSETEKDGMVKKRGRINGGMLKRQDCIQSPIITVVTVDLDSSIKKIKKQGGEIVKDKFKVGDIGFSAYFKDTEGNILGIFEPSKKYLEKDSEN